MIKQIVQKSCLFKMVSVHSYPQQSFISDAMGSISHVNSHWCTDVSVFFITGAFESDLSLHLPFSMTIY